MHTLAAALGCQSGHSSFEHAHIKEAAEDGLHRLWKECICLLVKNFSRVFLSFLSCVSLLLWLLLQACTCQRARHEHAYLQQSLRAHPVVALLKRAHVEEAPEEGLHRLERIRLLNKHCAQRRGYQRHQHLPLQEHVRRVQEPLECHEEEIVRVIRELVADCKGREARTRERDHWLDLCYDDLPVG